MKAYTKKEYDSNAFDDRFLPEALQAKVVQ